MLPAVKAKAHGEDTMTGTRETESASYDVIRQLIEEAKAQALDKLAAESRKRTRLVLIVAAVWLAICIALVVGAGSDMLLVAEIGFAAVAAWAIFFLFPSIMGKNELEELFGAYQARVDELQEHGLAAPNITCIEDLANL